MPNNAHRIERNTRNTCIYHGEHLSITLRAIANDSHEIIMKRKLIKMFANKVSD